MAEPILQCVPCKEAGVFRVAQYKEVTKARSHDGKYHPPMCYEHKNNGGKPVHSWQGEVDKVKAPPPPPSRPPSNWQEGAPAFAPAPNVPMPNGPSPSSPLKVAPASVVATNGNKYYRWKDTKKQVLRFSVGVATKLSLPPGVSAKRFGGWLRQDAQVRLYQWSCVDNGEGVITLTRLTDVPKNGKFSRLVQTPAPAPTSASVTPSSIVRQGGQGSTFDLAISSLQAHITGLREELKEAEGVLAGMERLKRFGLRGA
jgi:hypothetical protein